MYGFYLQIRAKVKKKTKNEDNTCFRNNFNNNIKTNIYNKPLQICLHIGTACPLLLHLGTNCEHKNRGNNVKHLIPKMVEYVDVNLSFIID